VGSRPGAESLASRRPQRHYKSANLHCVALPTGPFCLVGVDFGRFPSLALREKQALPCEPLDGKEAYTHGKGFAVRARTA
jgi:hypothetical protein